MSTLQAGPWTGLRQFWRERSLNRAPGLKAAGFSRAPWQATPWPPGRTAQARLRLNRFGLAPAGARALRLRLGAIGSRRIQARCVFREGSESVLGRGGAWRRVARWREGLARPGCAGQLARHAATILMAMRRVWKRVSLGS